MGIEVRVKVVEYGQHLGGMSTAAKDNKESCRLAASARTRFGWVAAREDVEEPELNMVYQ